MHPAAVFAWITELDFSSIPQPDLKRKQAASQRKTRRVGMADMLSNISSENESSNPNERPITHRIANRATRSSSPRKRKMLAADISDDDDELGEPTLRSSARPTRAIPTILHPRTFAGIINSKCDNMFGLQCDSFRSLSQSLPTSARSSSPKKVESLSNVGNGVEYVPLDDTRSQKLEQLGSAGLALLDTLVDVSGGPLYAASFKEHLVEAGLDRIFPHQLDHSDNRKTEDLLCELHTIQTINALSRRCLRNKDYESEWNNRVHTKVLELALGNDETNVGFRSVMTSKITTEFRPTHTPGFTTSKVVDYVIFLEPSPKACDDISSLVGAFPGSINHTGYEGLLTRPIAISIETKIESRTIQEAKLQLGVWLASQVARIESLIKLAAAILGENNDKAHLLTQIVFPLVFVQSETWSLFFGRISPNKSQSDIRTPASHIDIFTSMALGSTTNKAQTYLLVKSLKVLRTWVDGDFRQWWDRILDIDREVGSTGQE